VFFSGENKNLRKIEVFPKQWKTVKIGVSKNKGFFEVFEDFDEIKFFDE